MLHLTHKTCHIILGGCRCIVQNPHNINQKAYDLMDKPISCVWAKSGPDLAHAWARSPLLQGQLLPESFLTYIPPSQLNRFQRRVSHLVAVSRERGV